MPARATHIAQAEHYVHRVIIGEGQPLFQASNTKLHLRLAETRTFGDGVVLLRYERPEAQGAK
jgi:hypothetical protein